MATALYRDYLRAVRRLPTAYLQAFFQVRARQDLDNVVATPEPGLRARKHRDIVRRVRRLHRATSGDPKDFGRILALAYGRTGKLRWELLDPILDDPAVPSPKPLIPGLARTAPPIYAPELRRLLLTPTPRTKPLTAPELDTPRTLPARADPASDDAVLLGPLSKRREANIRRRAYLAALQRVAPPLDLAISTKPTDHTPSPHPVPADKAALAALRTPTSVYPRPLGLQGLGVTSDIETLIGSLAPATPLPRRARRDPDQSQSTSPDTPSAWAPPSIDTRHPQRWVRRRFRALLSSTPQLTYDPATGKYDAHISPLAISMAHRLTHYNPPADSVSLAWLTSGEDPAIGKGKGKKKTKYEKAHGSTPNEDK